MFKDFGKRLQRDLKKIVDARALAFEAKLDAGVKVSILNCILFLLFYSAAIIKY